ncbi:hypothetical protein Ahia01_000337000 [Argonauta hians]
MKILQQITCIAFFFLFIFVLQNKTLMVVQALKGNQLNSQTHTHIPTNVAMYIYIHTKSANNEKQHNCSLFFFAWNFDKFLNNETIDSNTNSSNCHSLSDTISSANSSNSLSLSHTPIVASLSLSHTNSSNSLSLSHTPIVATLSLSHTYSSNSLSLTPIVATLSLSLSLSLSHTHL